MYQKMSLVQKIGDQICVLAVAGLWGGIEGAPICMDRRTTRAGDKDLINKEIPAGSYLPDVVT
jgi:hypothetical protein